MAVKFRGAKDYSAMQGPCPDGFHVPLNTEWQAVYDIWTALGGGSSDGTNFGIALKLPFAGYRIHNNAIVGNQGTFGNYWSSSRYNADYAYVLRFNSVALSPQTYSPRTSGFSVRCFKNSPTIPTSSWTKLYGTSIEAGGIFWDNTDGLISLSSDGNTWITIADKNLGATTVWNSGDTLSEANCGKYYQWGNNYGFPRTGSVTTSSTQVDASAYGPGNYYSSSTFITRSSSPYRWDTTDNGNLWGGVTGIRPGELKAAYIGEKPKWTPGANTIAYYPFHSDLLDHSGNNNNWTSGNGTFANNMITTTSSLTRNALITATQDFTLSTYVDFSKTTATNGYAYIAIYGNTDGPTAGFWIRRTTNEFAGFKAGSWYTFTSSLSSSIHHLVLTRSSSTRKAYADGVLIGTKTVSGSLQSSTNQRIGSPNGYNYSITCGEVIMESVARTEQEVVDYYNQTKGNYGL